MHSHTKTSLRKDCLRYQRRIAAQPYRYGMDKRVQQRLERMIGTLRPRSIMAYVPLPTEADIFPLLQRWRRRGIVVYVPVMEGESFGLVEYRYPLKRQRFGVREPRNKRIIDKRYVDMALIPTVAFDGAYRRIGFGKGMYDRFFEKEGTRIGRRIFVMRTPCFTPKYVSDRHDVRADAIVTGT